MNNIYVFKKYIIGNRCEFLTVEHKITNKKLKSICKTGKMLPSLIKDKKQCCHINGDSEKYHIIAEIMTLQSLLFRIKDYIIIQNNYLLYHQKK